MNLNVTTYGKHSILLNTFLPNHSMMQTGYVLQPNENQWTFVSVWFLFFLFLFQFSLAEMKRESKYCNCSTGVNFPVFLLFHLSFALRTWRCCDSKIFHSQLLVFVFIQDSISLSDITRMRNDECTNCVWIMRCETIRNDVMWWAKTTQKVNRINQITNNVWMYDSYN